MQSIKDLIARHEVVWFSIGSEEKRHSQFLSELIEHDISWVNGTAVTKDDPCSYFMGVGANRRVGHVNWQIWRATWLNEEQNPENRQRFYSGGKIPLRVDYGKYIRGETDYVIKENIVENVAGFTYPIGGQAIPID